MNQTYRSRVAWVLGWLWMAFAAYNTWDLIAHGRIPSALIAGAVLGAITLLVFLLALRPATITRQNGVWVRNPLRNAFIPWHAVDQADVSNAIAITSGDTVVRCWTPQPTARDRARSLRGSVRPARRGRYPSMQPQPTKAEQAAAEALAGRTHSDWVAQQINELSESRKAESTGETRVTWSPSALAAIAATLVLIVLAIVLS
ncbi:hypothetical protein J5X84_03785 [Streptosporangiaceae bacterium NEAU-GS5]|nr:hypothetical protein [Streptosporangiaceae bacterium NEAU-GS5]